MDRDLLARCEAFITNRDRAKRFFSWASSYVHPICASILMDGEREGTDGDLAACKKLLKSQTGIFSGFRGIVEPIMISMLATAQNPEEELKKSITVYNMLKSISWSSEYLAVAATIVARSVEPEKYDFMAQRTHRIYKMMKSNHPWLTSGEDSIFAAMLAFSPRSDEEIIDETERCFKQLKVKFPSGNAVQSLSHVLALCDGGAEEKCRKTIGLYDGLKERGCSYGTSYELATLGVLANLPVSRETVVRNLLDVDEFLSGQKGYGFFGLGKKQRLMHAGMIVSGFYTEQSDAMSGAAIGGAVSLIAAEQAAMCACIAAASASSAAASSS